MSSKRKKQKLTGPKQRLISEAMSELAKRSAEKLGTEGRKKRARAAAAARWKKEG